MNEGERVQRERNRKKAKKKGKRKEERGNERKIERKKREKLERKKKKTKNKTKKLDTSHLLPALIWLMPHLSSSLRISGDSLVDRIIPV